MLKEITIVSGKGGTGKTSITAALATLAKKAVFCDNDVDAADLHLLFNPKVEQTGVFEGAWLARIDQSLCNRCGICFDHCRFGAIAIDDTGIYQVKELGCEGCRLCERVCPQSAITSNRSINNHWYVSATRFGYLVHAYMRPGEENSGKLVSFIRKKARDLARENECDVIINDGPPGIGCAAISSISGVNAVVLVAEPSATGLHDAQRVVDLCASFDVPVLAIINKYDICEPLTSKAEQFFDQKQIPILAKLPFDQQFVNAMVKRESIVEYAPRSEVALKITDTWKKIQDLLKK